PCTLYVITANVAAPAAAGCSIAAASSAGVIARNVSQRTRPILVSASFDTIAFDPSRRIRVDQTAPRIVTRPGIFRGRSVGVALSAVHDLAYGFPGDVRS